jgi:NAD(P)-dependent dehydrogenase (short-subunit alcohol dehydrogenase family)
MSSNEQRVVRVTGGMGGLGETISTIRADAGYKVMVTYSPGDTKHCECVDGMTSRGWGRVIDVSSVDGSNGDFGQTNHLAAEGGVHGFTKALAREVATKGVKVDTIAPACIAIDGGQHLQ